MDLKADAHYVLSGGMGALGMVTAQYLLEVGTAGQEATCFCFFLEGLGVGGGRGVKMNEIQ